MAIYDREDPHAIPPIFPHKTNEDLRNESHIITSWKENDHRFSRITPKKLLDNDIWHQGPVVGRDERASGVSGAMWIDGCHDAPALPAPYPGIVDESHVYGVSDASGDLARRLASARRHYRQYGEKHTGQGAEAVPAVPLFIGIKALDVLGITPPGGEASEFWHHSSGEDYDQPKYPIAGLLSSRSFSTADGNIAGPDPEVWGGPNDPLSRISTEVLSENSEPQRHRAPLSEDIWQPREY